MLDGGEGVGSRCVGMSTGLDNGSEGVPVPSFALFLLGPPTRVSGLLARRELNVMAWLREEYALPEGTAAGSNVTAGGAAGSVGCGLSAAREEAGPRCGLCACASVAAKCEVVDSESAVTVAAFWALIEALAGDAPSSCSLVTAPVSSVPAAGSCATPPFPFPFFLFFFFLRFLLFLPPPAAFTTEGGSAQSEGPASESASVAGTPFLSDSSPNSSPSDS